MISADLRQLASTFVEAQEWRHLAEYDTAGEFGRADVILFIDRIERANDG